MANRWRQENYFKYAREHFALDALDSYADQGDDRDRLVPNPAKAPARAQVSAANGDIAAAITTATIAARQPGNGGTATVDPAPGEELIEANTALAAAQDTSRATPSHLPLAAVRPGSRLSETERKLLTHAIRMSAYNTESALARLLRPHSPPNSPPPRPATPAPTSPSPTASKTSPTLHKSTRYVRSSGIRRDVSVIIPVSYTHLRAHETGR